MSNAQINKRIPNELLSRLSDFVNLNMGLYFPKDRWLDLLRGIRSAMPEFGFEDMEEGVRWLLSNPLKQSQIEVLACHLTVGETYFFREPKSFEALEKHILPKLIRARWQNQKRIRIWSAGCCTGEEAYSLAILLNRLIHDIQNWNITILATDINPIFIKKAQEGVYREWSFRGTPYWLKEQYFQDRGNGFYKILPQYKRMVKFQYLNLVEDTFPSIYNDTNAMDLIFCRNVLMYFSTKQVEKVISRFHQALLDDGWLITASSETSHIFYSQYITVNFPGAILYKKGAFESHGYTRIEEGFSTGSGHMDENVSLYEFPMKSPVKMAPEEPPNQEEIVEETPAPPSPETIEANFEKIFQEALQLYAQGHYENVIDLLLDSVTQQEVHTKAITLLAKAYANRGELSNALSWCEKALNADKLNPSFHHLHAIILQEQGEPDKAITALKRALYLNPNFVLPYFMLGNIQRQQGKLAEAEKHFENALNILSEYEQEDLLPESDGITAGRMRELIRVTMNKEMPA
ncbi:tetratricopeptide repeat protein [bacterium]|nr:tetratricopeptide repeat protein [bacterium]